MPTTLWPPRCSPAYAAAFTVDEQLELMRLAGIFVTPDSPSEPTTPPPTPAHRFPFTCVVATRSARRAAVRFAVPQFDTAANPKLTNLISRVQMAGPPRATSASKTALPRSPKAATQTSPESGLRRQRRRPLPPSPSPTWPGDQAYGPDDAFEVALLDANTGLSLLGGTGLEERCRAQPAGGRQRVRVSGISSVANADGSRTYLVDLPASPPARRSTCRSTRSASAMD